MDRFNINDIENLTGIKAHTLRIWEKRYSFNKPKRKESNHRYYDNEDLKHILKVAYLYQNGYKISKIAVLEWEALNRLAMHMERNGHTEQIFINSLLQNAFEFKQEVFEDTLNRAIMQLGFERCILKVVYPYFEKVGMLWMNDAAVPAQEHFSSNIIRNKIILAIDKLRYLEMDTTAPIALFMPKGEYHELPLLFTSYLLKKFGRPVIYFGGNTSLEELKLISKYTKAESFYFHMITNFTRQNIDEYLSMLSHNFPEKKIIMSGPLTCKVTEKEKNCILLTSLEMSLNFVKQGLADKYLK